MQIQAMQTLITRLKTATIPLSVDKQHQLGVWLEKFLAEHDESLLSDIFIKLEKEAMDKIEKNPYTKLL